MSPYNNKKELRTMRKRFLDLIRNGKKRAKVPAIVTWGFVAAGVLTIIAAIGVFRTQAEIREQRAKLEQLTVECQLQTSENEALDELLNNGSEYIERRAREDLDMVLPGERVYIIRAGS